MAFYNIGESFKWFMGRVVELDPVEDPPEERYMGRVKVRVLHDQTGELGKETSPYGIVDSDLLWAWPLSSIQSASLSYRKIVEHEEYQTPFWIDAVGTSPTGLAVGTYVFGFYLDGHEANIPVIFQTYHKLSIYPEPPTDGDNKFLQIKEPEQDFKYYDISGLAKGFHTDPQRELNHPMGHDMPTDTAPEEGGQILPKHFNKEYSPKGYQKGGMNIVWEPPSDYDTKYPFNLTHTTKSGHAFEIDDTPGHERIQWWHRSGSYEEVSNGPPEKNRDGLKGEYPYAMFNGWNEPADHHDPSSPKQKWEGRRVRKTTESEYNLVFGNKETLVNSSLKLEVANNSTTGLGNNQIQTVGNNVFLAVGYYPRTANTKVHSGESARYQLKDSWDKETTVDNALASTDKKKQIIPDTHKFDFITDVANNVQLSIGWTWKKARELDTHSEKNNYVEIANNQYTSLGWIPQNNYDKDGESRQLSDFEKTNQYFDIKGNSVTNIGWKPKDEARLLTDKDINNVVVDIKNNNLINLGWHPIDEARQINYDTTTNYSLDIKNNSFINIGWNPQEEGRPITTDDIANHVVDVKNNHMLNIGYEPADGDTRKLSSDDTYNYYVDVKNSTSMSTLNNFYLNVGNLPKDDIPRTDKVRSLFISTSNDRVDRVGKDYVIDIRGNANFQTIGNTLWDFHGLATFNARNEFVLNSPVGITLNAPSVVVLGPLYAQKGVGQPIKLAASGTFTAMNGRVITVTNGIITDIGDPQ